MDKADKASVHDFWNAAACGETLYLRGVTRDAYEAHARIRYALEPEILAFADFARWRGKTVLEIGVGLGADHARFAEHGAILTGIDLTERAVGHARTRMETLGLTSRIEVGDADNLPFADATFDLVYSWGVLHHSPDTARCVREAHRVLKPGGTAKVMIYHTHSMVGYIAVDSLRPAAAAPVHAAVRDLRPPSREPRHQGLYRRRGAPARSRCSARSTSRLTSVMAIS